MAGLTSSGVGSGLDVKGIVDALVQADITPTKNRLDKQEASITTQLSALGQIKSALSNLQTSMIKLSNINQFYALKSSVSDTSIVSASVNNDASAGQYQIVVQTIATKQNLASSSYINSSSTVGNGSITIDFGTYSNSNTVFTANPDKQSVTINIAPGQDSLSAIRDAINNSGSGVQANIVKDSSGYRLTLSSPETGQSLAMRISVIDNDGTNNNSTGLSALAFDPTIGNNSLTQTTVAKDSQVSINGLLLTQSSNQLKNAIEGVTIDLKKAQPGTLVDLTIANNDSQLTNAVNEFIKQYNDTMTTINSLTSYNAETKKGGTLQADSGVRTLKLNLSKILGEPVAKSGSTVLTLADIGIKTNKQGLLEMDSDKFNTAVANNYDAIAALFAKTATATDTNIRIKSVGNGVKTGLYNLVINSFVPGTSLSGTIGGVNATSSDGLTLKGTSSFQGLSVEVLAGSTGARGQIEITDGLAVKLNNLLTNYLGDTGDLSTKTEQLNGRLGDIDSQRAQLTTKASTLSNRYTKQFTALDALLVKMQSTSDFLTQQLANLPQLTANRG
ncbi:flagellar filament capping protein FliD [Legionella feeleii]|uniref:Flagellar hook-associated protein 2 n=1 Tax=Legionella feeleii TaxID=453 RepID=A0A0W0TIR5_9GAMM|nr:flagellar filament capping protein FliD [Legionella feeleii]KTC95480.1 flagellar hook associated protein 2 FliD [Legionella feeleii]SPX60064.1 flagellar hook-associated protein 2 [Legionella feeleii]